MKQRVLGGGLRLLATYLCAYTRHILYTHTHIRETLNTKFKALTKCVWKLQDGLMLIFPVHKTNRLKPKQTAVGPSL